MVKINILGVLISKITNKDAIKTVTGWLNYSSNPVTGGVKNIKDSSPRRFGKSNNKKYLITTPNPEMLVLANRDSEFKEILNHSDLALPDGVGLIWANRILNLVYGLRFTVYGFILHTVRRIPYAVYRTPYTDQFPERISGTDFMLSLCEMASQKGFTVGLLGAGEGVAQKTEEVLKEKFPGLKIAFAVTEISDLSNLSHLSNLKIDLLFVAFGAPKQEKWIWEQLKIDDKKRKIENRGLKIELEKRKIEDRKLKIENNNLSSNIHLQNPSSSFNCLSSNVYFKVGMGVGGAFDQISGKIPRAPQIMRKFGLEWLWRLILEPKRIGRIFNATMVFSWLVFCFFLKSPKLPKSLK